MFLWLTKTGRGLIREHKNITAEIRLIREEVRKHKSAIVEIQKRFILERQLHEMFRDALTYLASSITAPDGRPCYCGGKGEIDKSRKPPFDQKPHSKGCQLARDAFEKEPRE